MGSFIGNYGTWGHPVLHRQVARRANWCRVFPTGRSIETVHYYVIARPTPRLDMGETGKEQFNAHFDPLTEVPLTIRIPMISPMHHVTSFLGADFGGWERCLGLWNRGGRSCSRMWLPYFEIVSAPVGEGCGTSFKSKVALSYFS